MNSRIRFRFYIFFLNPVYAAARSLRSLRSNNTIQYSAVQCFIDTPLVGLFSDNATNNKDIHMRINYTIKIIKTYYTKYILKLKY